MWAHASAITRHLLTGLKKELLKFIRPEPNSTYNIHGNKGLKLHTRFRLGLNHLGDNKLAKFSKLCLQCALAVRILKQQLTSSFNHHCARKTLNKINQVSGTISRQSDSTITKISLFIDNKLDFETSRILLMSAIKFISLTERSSCSLFE